MDFLLTLLTIASGNAYGQIKPVVSGEIPNKIEVRRAYAMTGIFTLAMGSILAVVLKSPRPLIAAAPIVLANVAVLEWAIAISSVEKARPSNRDDAEAI